MACDPGRERWNTVMGVFLEPSINAGLYIYDYKDAAKPDAEVLKEIEIVNFPGKSDFHTLGMAYDEATSTLFAVNHARAGSRIERFTLDVDRLVATHTGTIQHPLLHAPNSIAIINSKELYITNDHYFLARTSKLLARMETFLAPALASVVHVKLRDGPTVAGVESVNVVARAAFANGIEFLNSTTLAVASTTRNVIYLYESHKNGSLSLKSSIQVPFLPDNLSVHGGKLFIAGHPHFTSLAKFTQTRHVCNDPEELGKASADLKEYCQTGVATSWVSEWTEKGGLKSLYAGTEYPTSCTAAKDTARGVGIVSGLYAKGILVWRD
ncbi:hypothetical protein QQS21_012444 [Conoideocrella luteorostrata]|uniref:Uncharacterized protein n=1 Tax=Conoideocrella luteorostrata TaxID=1105319 RepID=A0AAJ0CB66_9HYPO|nr:hypothetical protein QQS21_012444 [Conoideocrella luteorostrata]